MKINVEMSYYPFTRDNFKEIVKNVIADIENFKFDINYTPLSTLVKGDHKKVLKMVQLIIEKYFPDNPSVFECKFCNAC